MLHDLANKRHLNCSIRRIPQHKLPSLTCHPHSSLWTLSPVIVIICLFIPSFSVCLFPDEERQKGDSDLHGNSPATGCVLTTNQIRLRLCLSSNGRCRGGEAVQGVCGAVKVNAQRGVIMNTLPGWTENVSISE